MRPFLKGGFWRSFLAPLRRGQPAAQEDAAHERASITRCRRASGAATSTRRCCAVSATARTGTAYSAACICRTCATRCGRNCCASEYAMDNVAHRGRKWVDIEKTDFDADGHDEILMENAYAERLPRAAARRNALRVGLPAARLQSAEHADAPRRSLSLQTGARGAATKSGDAPEAGKDSEATETASIHDLVLTKEPGLDKALRYDRWPRTRAARSLSRLEFDDRGIPRRHAGRLRRFPAKATTHCPSCSPTPPRCSGTARWADAGWN